MTQSSKKFQTKPTPPKTYQCRTSPSAPDSSGTPTAPASSSVFVSSSAVGRSIRVPLSKVMAISRILSSTDLYRGSVQVFGGVGGPEIGKWKWRMTGGKQTHDFGGVGTTQLHRIDKNYQPFLWRMLEQNPGPMTSHHATRQSGVTQTHVLEGSLRWVVPWSFRNLQRKS